VSAFLIFFGRSGSSDLERQLDAVKIAIGAVVMGRAADAGFSRLYAVTNDQEAAAAFRSKGASVLPVKTDPFHFGRELKRIVDEKKLDRLCTIGAGAGALMTTHELRSPSIFRRRTTRFRGGSISKPASPRDNSRSPPRRCSTSTRQLTPRSSRATPGARRSCAPFRHGRTCWENASRRSCGS